MAQQVFKIADATKVKLITKDDRVSLINSLTVANIHSGDAAVDLYLVSQVGTKITDTGTDSNEGDIAPTTGSVTLAVNGTAATDEVFKDERVYMADGSFIGVCTARNSNTEIVFENGIESTLSSTASLYTGTKYYIFKGLVIPTGQTLKLESDEVSFDNKIYNLYVKLAGSTPVDIILKH